MFKRRRKEPPTQPQREPFTYVHQDTTICGELNGSGRVRIHGTVRGNVRVDGVLEVAEAGLVEGSSVVADEVKIIGRMLVESVTARGKVEIWRGGELIGNVKAAALDIEDGARFTGRSEMTSLGGPEEPSGASDELQADTEASPAQEQEPAAAPGVQPLNAHLELLGQSDDAKL